MAAISVARSELGGGEGEEAVQRLRSADPALYLSPSPEISQLSRAASAQLFSLLLPFCPKVPFDRLIAGDGFDAEQIWEQIDSLSRPLVSMLAREMKRLERDGVEGPVKGGGDGGEAAEEVEAADEEEDDDESEDNELEEVDEDELAEDEEEEEPADAKGSGIEDRFLKIKELEEYLENDEAKEYGHQGRGMENEDAETDDDANFEFGDFGGDDDEDSDLGEYARYEDFFQKRLGGKNSGGKKEKGTSKKVKFVDELEDLEMDEYKDNQDADAEMDEPKDRDVDTWDNALSTHEKELQKIHSNIKQMEKSNLEPKSWTMQGEVTAAKRPKNSALEVDLDFEHNVRPAPVITEEVQASIEDLIKKRIHEEHFDDVQRAFALPTKAPKELKELDENKSKKGLAEICEEEYGQKAGLASVPLSSTDEQKRVEHFDDVQRAFALPTKAPKELKELDENKSKKGLAEIYEEEYGQKAGLASVPLSSTDEQKRVATNLFKKVCLKLDILSHFHYAPKPIIEEMSIQASVPALVMEEIAPVAVSDAAMLAPEEIFEGKGDIKEETELTQAERKRHRANKKRKFRVWRFWW